MVPRLAESSEVSGDGLVWTFHLRRDAVWNASSSRSAFHEAPVTAHDFAFALSRMFDPAAFSPSRGVLLGQKRLAHPERRGAPVLARRVRTRDYTLEITLIRQDSRLPELLSASYARAYFSDSTGHNAAYYFVRQLFFAAAGTAAMFILSRFPMLLRAYELPGAGGGQQRLVDPFVHTGVLGGGDAVPGVHVLGPLQSVQQRLQGGGGDELFLLRGQAGVLLQNAVGLPRIRGDRAHHPPAGTA